MNPDELSELYPLIDAYNTVSLSNTSLLYPNRHTRTALPVLVIDHPLFDAQIILQGAQLIQFTPKNSPAWLWLSPLADFQKGNAVRGGIPICFPWFGVNKDDANKPKHGFVRQQSWQLDSIKQDDDALQITLKFCYRATTPHLYPHPFDAEIGFTLSDKILIDFTFTNRADKPLTYSYVLHSYFAVDELATAQIEGLDNINYLDNAKQGHRKKQAGNIVFTQEVDRIFATAPEQQALLTHQNIVISSSTCKSCIVWNPHKLLASTMKDTQHHYKRFVCVEKGCVENQSIKLDENQTHSTQVQIKTIHHL